jgi:hypothetical protein
MIIRMTTMFRPQQRYDHRLRDLVRRTRDVTLATDLGVPRSLTNTTAHFPIRRVADSRLTRCTSAQERRAGRPGGTRGRRSRGPRGGQPIGGVRRRFWHARYGILDAVSQKPIKPVVWVGDSLRILKSFPPGVQGRGRVRPLPGTARRQARVGEAAEGTRIGRAGGDRRPSKRHVSSGLHGATGGTAYTCSMRFRRSRYAESRHRRPRST